MTNRELYNAILNSEAITDEMRDYAREAIEKLDGRNKARAAKANSKAEAENAPKIAAIMGYLQGAENAVKASEIAEATELTTAKVSALLRKLVDAGRVISHDNKNKPKTYEVAGEDE